MANKDELKRLIDELPEAETDRALGLLVSLLHSSEGSPSSQLDQESCQWLEMGLEDTVRGIAAAEAGVSPEELKAWLERMEAGSQPIQWDADKREFTWSATFGDLSSVS